MGHLSYENKTKKINGFHFESCHLSGNVYPSNDGPYSYDSLFEAFLTYSRLFNKADLKEESIISLREKPSEQFLFKPNITRAWFRENKEKVASNPEVQLSDQCGETCQSNSKITEIKGMIRIFKENLEKRT